LRPACPPPNSGSERHSSWLGSPAAALAGWIVGPRIRPGKGFVGAALAMAILTTVVADAIIVLVWVTTTMASGATSTPIATALGGSLVLWGLGLVFVGIPMLLVTVPCGLIWAAFVRRSAGPNVVGITIPAMIGWTRFGRSGVDARGSTAPGPARPGDVIGFNRRPFVAGPAIGLVAVVASGAVVALPDIARIALGLAGLGALVQTSAAVFATWRVFGPDAPRRWDWIRSEASDSRSWLNVTTGFDDSTGRLRIAVPCAGAGIDVFDSTRSHATALRHARSSFPPSGPSVTIASLGAPIASASVDTVFLLMSAHEAHGQERAALFATAQRALVPGGRVVVVEHLRDPANILAFGPGAWHFSRRHEWLATAAAAGLKLVAERRLDPWVTGFVFGRGQP
jgi:hypothetical protein